MELGTNTGIDQEKGGKRGEIAKGVSGVINELHLVEEDEVESPIPAILAGDEDQTGISDTLP